MRELSPERISQDPESQSPGDGIFHQLPAMPPLHGQLVRRRSRARRHRQMTLAAEPLGALKWSGNFSADVGALNRFAALAAEKNLRRAHFL